ncbi:hypothetical protein JCM10213v2_001889 [Rhodosporidiobolus nylandii]
MAPLTLNDNPFESPDFLAGLEAAGYLQRLDTSEARITARYQHALSKMQFAAHSEEFLTRAGVKKVHRSTVQFFNEIPVSDPFVHVMVGSLPPARQALVTPRGCETSGWTPIGSPDEADGTVHFTVSHPGFWPVTVVFDVNQSDLAKEDKYASIRAADDNSDSDPEAYLSLGAGGGSSSRRAASRSRGMSSSQGYGNGGGAGGSSSYYSMGNADRSGAGRSRSGSYSGAGRYGGSPQPLTPLSLAASSNLLGGGRAMDDSASESDDSDDGAGYTAGRGGSNYAGSSYGAGRSASGMGGASSSRRAASRRGTGMSAADVDAAMAAMSLGRSASRASNAGGMGRSSSRASRRY